MGSKNNPGRFDCYAKAHPDEPMFVLLGRDKHAAETVRNWAARRREEKGIDDKYLEAIRCANGMDDWRRYHADEVSACEETPPVETAGVGEDVKGVLDVPEFSKILPQRGVNSDYTFTVGVVYIGENLRVREEFPLGRPIIPEGDGWILIDTTNLYADSQMLVHVMWTWERMAAQ